MNENKIGKFIAEERKKKKMTQKDLAEKLYVTDRAVSKWERGLSYPDILLLEKISNIFEVNVSELLNGERVKEMNKEKADNIVKDSLVIYKKSEKKKIYHKLKVIFIAIVIIIFAYSFYSLKFFKKIYITPNSYIELDTKESKQARKNADSFMNALKKGDIKTINKLLNKYLTTPEPPIAEESIKDNIKKYNDYLEEFYDNFSITNFKHTYSSRNGNIYTHEYELNIKHKETNSDIFCYVQIKSDSSNVYIHALGYEDDDLKSMNFIDNNEDIWESINNILSHAHLIENLNVKYVQGD